MSAPSSLAPRWLAIGTLLVIALAGVALVARRREAAPATDAAAPAATVGEVVILGAWERSGPLLTSLGEEHRVTMRTIPAGRVPFAEIEQTVGSPDLLLLLNAPSEEVLHYERAVRAIHARGVRVVALDARPWQGGLERSGDLVRDETLTRYWRYSGRENLGAMMDHLAATYLGDAERTVAPPSVLPTRGLYHPDARGLATDVASYLRDYAAARADLRDRPLVAYVVHSSFLALDETEDIDALIHTLESRQIRVATVFGESENDLASMLTELHPALLLTQRHVGLGRPADANTRPLPERIGVPFLKPISALATTVEEWETRPEGLLSRDLSNQVIVQELEGTIEPIVVSALATSGESRVQRPIPERMQHFADRAASWLRLQSTPNPEKRLAIIYYNAELGGENVGQGSVSGMFLDVPHSLVGATRVLAEQGYRVEVPESAEALIARMTATGRNYGPWAQADIDRMAQSGEAVLIAATDYVEWFESSIPEAQRLDVIARHGEAPGTLMTTSIHGLTEIVIPRVRLGENVWLFPQPEKGLRQDPRLAHDQTIPPSHQYIAFYLWLQREMQPHAVVHFGTHGTLELLPRRAAGLGPEDFADRLLGPLPNINPWILDNVAEATLARRRAYAVLVDHLVPPIEGVDPNAELRTVHEEVDRAVSLEPGAVRDASLARLVDRLTTLGFATDLLDDRTLDAGELTELDLRFHALLEESAPRSLHVLGVAPNDARRAEFVAAIRGRAFFDRAGDRAAAVALVRCAILEARPSAECLAPHARARHEELTADLAACASIDADLARAPDETAHLLDALEGRYVPPGPGNDPIRTRSAIPTGRNLYALDPESVPTEPAMDVAERIVVQTIEAHVAAHERPLQKIAINLNGFETMRDTGVTEGQILRYIGVEPVRDDQGHVSDVRLIPREELGRARVDVSIAISGAYRDNFASRIRLWDRAVRLAQDSPEEDNPLHAHLAADRAELVRGGMAEAAAERAARHRIFGQPPGQYGTQILALVPHSGAWQDRSEIARVYRENMQFAYGEEAWGEAAPEAYARSLAGVDAVSHVWASNMMSPLTNHHVYEYAGGLSLAVTDANGGVQPDTWIADVRDPNQPRTRALGEVLDTEREVRLFNARWIREMREGGYAGAGHVAAYVENLFGWESTTPGSVPSTAFERVRTTYLEDAETRAWLEEANPDALLSVTATLVESMRRGYYTPSDEVRDALVRDYMEQVTEHGPSNGLMAGGNDSLASYVEGLADQPAIAPVAAAYRARVAEASRTEAAAAQALEAARARTAEAVRAERANSAPRHEVAGMVVRESGPTWPVGLLAMSALGALVIGGGFAWRARRGGSQRRSGEGPDA